MIFLNIFRVLYCLRIRFYLLFYQNLNKSGKYNYKSFNKYITCWQAQSCHRWNLKQFQKVLPSVWYSSWRAKFLLLGSHRSRNIFRVCIGGRILYKWALKTFGLFCEVVVQLNIAMNIAPLSATTNIIFVFFL